MLSVMASGCSPSFTPASLIEDERVTAVVADPPEAVPGQVGGLWGKGSPGIKGDINRPDAAAGRL